MSGGETTALVIRSVEVAAFCWSPDYGDVFLPVSRALRLRQPGRSAHERCTAAEIVPTGAWLRLRVSRQAPRKGYHWLGEALERLPDDAEKLLRIREIGKWDGMEVEGLGTICTRRGSGGGPGLIWSPRLGRVQFEREVLPAGAKLPPPLVHVSFVARVRTRDAVEDGIKFRAVSVRPYKGPPAANWGIQAFRCLGREVEEAGPGLFHFLVARMEGEQVETRIRAERRTLAAGMMQDLECKTYLVYAVPLAYTIDDVPGAWRLCEWEAVVVELQTRPPSPRPAPSLPTTTASMPLTRPPGLTASPLTVEDRPSRNSSSVSPATSSLPSTEPPQASTVELNEVVEDAAEAARREIGSALLDAVLEDEEILKIVSERYSDLLMKYLTLCA